MRTLLLSALLFFSACQTARISPAVSEPAVPLTPTQRADAAYHLGMTAMADRDFEKAENLFFECIDLHDKFLKCRWELGWAQFSQRHWMDADEAWEMVEHMNPKYDNLVESRALLHKYMEIDRAAHLLRLKAPTTLRTSESRKSLIRIRASGDTMLGTDFPKNKLPPETGQSPLWKVESLLHDADISFVNHEGTLCSTGTSQKCAEESDHCYSFRSPPDYVKYLKQAGITAVSIANNHILDFGEECRLQTAETLQMAGIKWSGPAGSFASIETHGKSIAIMSFHSAAHSNDTTQLKEAQKLVRALKKTHDLVIVSFHGGAEGFNALHVPRKSETFYGENRGDVYAFAHAVVDAGANLVLGSGPHVVRGMEFYKGRLIAYSLGNFATYGTFNLSGFNALGLLLEVDLDKKGRFRGGRIIPLKQTGKGFVSPDPDASVVDLVRYLSKEDFKKTAVLVARDGTIHFRRLKERK